MSNFRQIVPVYTVEAGVLDRFSEGGEIRRVDAGRGGVERRGIYGRYAKRVFDVVMVVLAAPIVVPLVGILALIIASDGANPLYLQRRVGAGGRTFRMWKMRTMVPNAKAALEGLLATDEEARSEWETTQKLRDDPRVTGVGRFLRRTSLDELPQLWNVLKGDMSLVGPRPMMPEQQPLYSGESYYRLRPGITGSWQVSSRNASTFSDRARFDLDYDKSLSFLTDLRILTATVRVVLKATGH